MWGSIWSFWRKNFVNILGIVPFLFFEKIRTLKNVDKVIKKEKVEVIKYKLIKITIYII